MSTKRVIVFGMHEHEIAAAQKAMPDGDVTESFVVGEADDAAIADLRNRRLGRKTGGPSASRRGATGDVQRGHDATPCPEVA
jgi:hypothetical protein